jgi:IS30 family transposase
VGGPREGRRLPLREAAEVLGVSKDAVRQRVKRGTIRSDKGEDGRVYVYVDASSETTTDGVHSTGRAADELLECTEELITTLREQLQAERQAHAEARRLLAAALERIPPRLRDGEMKLARNSPDYGAGYPYGNVRLA